MVKYVLVGTGKHLGGIFPNDLVDVADIVYVGSPYMGLIRPLPRGGGNESEMILLPGTVKILRDDVLKDPANIAYLEVNSMGLDYFADFSLRARGNRNSILPDTR